MQCPTKERLQSFCREELPPDEEAVLLEHIEQCPSCREVIDKSFGQLPLPAQALFSESTADESQLLRERLSQLKVQRPSPLTTNAPRYEDLQPWIDTDEDSTGPGQVGHYDLIRCIGRGGMGVVFEAYDRQLHRPVALKMMSPSLLVDPTNSKRILREARAVAAIDHPSVVTIHAVSKVRDLPYLVMELVDCETLHGRLEANSPLDVDEAIEIALQLAEGLAAAHAVGVVHRDIKPANILVDRATGNVKLTDFGLAHTMHEEPLTRSGTLVGTPEYLAPEQINGLPVDHRSDLFSLGSVLHHMCSGQPPFAGASIVATLQNVTTDEPSSLSIQNRNVPAWLSALVTQLHAKDPVERIPDAETAATVLRSKGRLGLKRTSRMSRRSLGKTFTLATSLLLALAFGFFQILKEPGPQIADSTEALMQILGAEGEDDLQIRLTSAAPYRITPIAIANRSLKLEAKKGNKVVLVFDESLATSAIECTNGRLVMSGVRIKIRHAMRDGGSTDSEDTAVINCIEGKVVLTDCEIESSHPCIALTRSDCHIRETNLISQTHAIQCTPVASNRIEIESSQITSECAIDFSKSAEGSLTVSNTLIQAIHGFQFLHENSERKIRIETRNNDLECDHAIAIVHDVHPDQFQGRDSSADLPFRWLGSENRKTTESVLLYDGEELVRSLQINDVPLPGLQQR